MRVVRLAIAASSGRASYHLRAGRATRCGMQVERLAKRLVRATRCGPRVERLAKRLELLTPFVLRYIAYTSSLRPHTLVA